MTYEELKNIGVENLLTDASLKNLAVESECFLAKWGLSMAWHLAKTENMGEYRDWETSKMKFHME